MINFTTFLWLEYIAITLVSIVGVEIYFCERKKIDANDVWKFFLMMGFVKILDVLSTIRFTSKNGIHTEGNAVARYFMNSLGIYKGIAVFLVVSLPVLFFFSVIVNYYTRGNYLWKLYKILLISIGVIVVFMNLI